MTDRCTEYARAVVEGRVGRRVGELEVLAAQRHLRDLERQNTAEFPYYYDPEEAAKIIEYAETLTITEGFERKPVRLFGFQDFIFGSLFGWRRSADGYRRFRLSYIEKARQNGKSFDNGILGTYTGNFAGYQNGQLYLVATKQDQARIVFEAMKQFIEADPDLEELFEIKDYRSEIVCKLTGCRIRALSRDAKRIDGFRPIFGSVDEYHAHETNQMYKLLEGGTGNLPETLISIITTAGFDLNSPCYEMRRISEQILRGTFQKETQFVMIFSLDKDDDIWDPLNWAKANPLICATPEGIERMKDIAETARLAGGNEMRDFLTKRLNIWVQGGENRFVSEEDVLRCRSRRTLASFEGFPCYIGIDLSSGGDLTSIDIEIPFMEGDRQKYYFWSHSFMPRGRLMEHVKTDSAPYDMWEKDGLITVTGGAGDFKNDYSFIIKVLRETIDRYQLLPQAIGYDPHNADGILAELETFGCPVVAITQSAKNLNDATVDLQLLIRQGDVEFDERNALFTWSLVNANVVANSFGEIKIDKEPGKRTRRIDPVDAAIDAHVLAMKQRKNRSLDEAAEEYFKLMGWEDDDI